METNEDKVDKWMKNKIKIKIKIKIWMSYETKKSTRNNRLMRNIMRTRNNRMYQIDQVTLMCWLNKAKKKKKEGEREREKRT